jgi:methionyl-tRNA formyltransferase
VNHTIVLSTVHGAEGVQENKELIESYGVNCVHVGNLKELELIASKGDFSIISDRTTYLIPDNIIKKTSGLAVNLHNSLLPIHPGSYALFWSCIYGDPYGITVHNLTNKLDQGEILFQLKVDYSFNNTFKEVYAETRKKAQIAIRLLLCSILENYKFGSQEIFKKSWDMHLTKNAKPLLELLPKSWDTKIIDARNILRGKKDESGRVIN